MALTEVSTEKVFGRISNVHIGYDATHGVNIIKGIKSFKYDRVHSGSRAFTANYKTANDVLQSHSHYIWRLEFLSDCRVAFFATDVQVGAGNQYALDENGASNKIEYFRVILPIVNSSGVDKTRTYTITNGFCLLNGTYIGDDEDAVYWYEGNAEEITYSDA